MFATRVIQRSLGLVSLLILARLLTPEDFGVVATAMIAVQVFSLLGETGAEEYIIQKHTVDDADLNTAWSLDILFKLLLFVLLNASAQFATLFSDSPDVVPAIRVLSVMLLIQALTNPGSHLLKRELDYRRLFRVYATSKFVSFLVAITLALALKNFWAMVVGSLVAAAVDCAGTYWAHQFRPRWSLSRLRQQFVFSRWVMLRAVVGYSSAQVDNAVVSASLGTTNLGRYFVPREIASVPATELLQPLLRPLLASFAGMQSDLSYAAGQLRTVLVLVMACIIPMCVYVYAFPEPIVGTLLGQQWIGQAEVLSALAPIAASAALLTVFTSMGIAIGRIAFLFAFNLVSLVVLATSMLMLAPENLEQLAHYTSVLRIVEALALAGCISTLVSFGFVRTVLLGIPFMIAATIAAQLAGIVPAADLPLLRLVATGTVHVTVSLGLTASCILMLRTRVPEYEYLYATYRVVAGRCQQWWATRRSRQHSP